MVHPCLIFSNASDRLLRRSNEIYRNEIDKAGCIPASWVQSVTQSSQPCFNSAQTPGGRMSDFIRRIWSDDEGQDIAEYAVMLAVILVLVVGTIRLIGSNSNTVFSS